MRAGYTPSQQVGLIFGAGSLRAVNGAFSEVFKQIVQPAANAGATFMAKNIVGTFQGMMAATGPMGCLKVMLIYPGVFKLVVP